MSLLQKKKAEYRRKKVELEEEIQRLMALLDRIEDGVARLRAELGQRKEELMEAERLFLMGGE